MVVNTQTERVRHAQNAVVEFLLVNHPLDCPVCDKGGECPLQDITFGWGLGRSRFIEPKRHFQKPLALSPLVAIDRERCILCYRCVRFSQEIAEDYQLIFAERGAHTFVGHPRRTPVRRPVQRQHHRAVPGRGAHLAALPLPGAAVGHRGRGRHLHAVPGAVQRHLHRPRRARRPRAGARQRRGRRRLAVRQGPLRLSGDPRRRAHHPPARARRRRAARGLLGASAGGGGVIAKHKGRIGALVGGQATNEEGFLLQRLLREGLSSNDIDSRATGPADPVRRARARAGRARACRRASPTSSSPTPCCCVGCRARRRRADPRSADPQGRAPQRRQAGDRRRASELAGAQRHADRCATPPARRTRSLAALDQRAAPARDGARPSETAALAALLRDGGERHRDRLRRADRRRRPPPRCCGSPSGSSSATTPAPGC